MWALCVIKFTQQVSCSRERLKTHAALYNSDILCSGMVSTIRFFRRFLLTVGVFGRSTLDCDVYLVISVQMSESHCIFSWKQTLHMINIKQYSCNYCQYLYLTFQKWSGIHSTQTLSRFDTERRREVNYFMWAIIKFTWISYRLHGKTKCVSKQSLQV